MVNKPNNHTRNMYSFYLCLGRRESSCIHKRIISFACQHHMIINIILYLACIAVSTTLVLWSVVVMQGTLNDTISSKARWNIEFDAFCRCFDIVVISADCVRQSLPQLVRSQTDEFANDFKGLPVCRFCFDTTISSHNIRIWYAP